MKNENTTKEYKPRVYGRAELAHLYHGGAVTDAAARRWFMNELSHYEGLMEELEQLGFKKTGKTFSYGQVKAIFRFLGPPEA